MNLFIFILGLFIGSFLGVLSDRLPKSEQVLKGRSHCDFCKRKLQPLDLVPVLSFLFLKGRCRYCRKRLSIKYPVVELLTGMGFLLISNYINLIPLPSPVVISLVYLLIIYSGLLVIFLADIKYFIIPDQIVVFLVITDLVYKILYQVNLLPYSIISAAGATAFILFFHIITRGKGMGFGDVKLAFFMGLFLGFPGIVIAFYMSFLTGAFFSVILIIIGKAKLKSKIAFGPYLAGATLVSFFWQRQILYLFSKLFI